MDRDKNKDKDNDANNQPEASARENTTPKLSRNFVSLTGMAIALLAAANIAFLVFIDFLSGHPSPYLGIFAYVLFPAVMVVGLLLIPIGMVRERRRRREHAPSAIPQFPCIDLNDSRQRRRIAAVLTATVLFVIVSAAGSYRAFEFTESVSFCGQVCHSVMSPEFVAYQQSPHARVACVECHVGSGPQWYVKSKLTGAHQLYSLALHKYQRPIPTPVANLRPAQETCEQCHWPGKFWGEQLKIFPHFAANETNTPREVRMLINVGGANPVMGKPAGIHWHMNLANQISYVATDAQRQTIPWVQEKNLATGKVTVYAVKDAALKPDQIAPDQQRRMDCVDCHNRPTHIFVPPDQSVDRALNSGLIDPSLPFIKQQAVTLLTGSYDTAAQAKSAIATGLETFYREKFPEVWNKKQASVQEAVATTQHLLETSIFPEMKTDWRAHPSNLGHLYSLGCFRCHDGNHVSADGKVISKECNTCHTMQPATAPAVVTAAAAPAFQHPVDIGDLTAVNCSDCHTGGTGP